MSKLSELKVSHPEEIKAMLYAWRNTLQKCKNPNHHDYGYYGARGIQVCERWHSFENFVEDMGLRPEGLTLERKNNNGNYEPSNCEWATRQRQTENRRVIAMVEWQGRRMTVAAWEREFGWKAGTLKARLGRLGYTLEEAMTKPVKFGSRVEGKQYVPRKRPDMSNVPRGLDHYATKLTPEDLKAMRDSHASGESFSSLARRFKVSVTTSSNAVQKLKAYKDT